MKNLNYIDIIGLCAAVLTTAAFLPQVYKTWKTKDVAALSLPMLSMFFVGVFMWLGYGLLLSSLSLILANSITLVSVLLLFIFKIKYRKK